jgi:3-phenylpropionate/trans-cinnamate dioxygenase ferredoxin subunit
MPDIHQLGDLSDLRDGDMRSFEDVDDHGIVVCRVGGELYALEDNCSHADTPLSEGRLRGTSITCPLHGACFDVRDGTHSGPPAFTGVTTYRVAETGTGVTVERAVTSEAR